MKKAAIAIIAVLYFGVSSGIAMEIHYCMGKRSGMDFYGEQKDKCGKCGMSGKKAGCCNDEFKFLKINDSYKNVSNQIVFGTVGIAILPVYQEYKSNLANTKASLPHRGHAPPGFTRPSACIMNCVFRI